ncbi:MAG: lipoprotein-releasing ABC transporter permease subunit [Pseudomonadota bacterium]
MTHSLLLSLTWRFATTRRGNRFASLMAVVSLFAIAIASGALLLVVSVINGFETEITNHLIARSAHATLFRPFAPIVQWRGELNKLGAYESVVGAAPYIRSSGMVTAGSTTKGIVLEGIDIERESSVSLLPEMLVDGDLDDLAGGGGAVIVGKHLAAELNLSIGDKLRHLSVDPKQRASRVTPRLHTLTIVGIFASDLYEFDSRLIITNLQTAQKITATGQAVTGFRIKFEEARLAPSLARQIAREFGPQFAVLDWTQYHRNFFLALASQKRILFVILSLIIGVAAFNIVSNIAMLVMEKTAAIAILRTLGARRSDLVKLFVLQGTLTGLCGALIGIVLGSVLCAYTQPLGRWVEALAGFKIIKPEVYFIDYLPALLRGSDATLVFAVTAVVAMLAALFPAWRAARIAPAEILRGN